MKSISEYICVLTKMLCQSQNYFNIKILSHLIIRDIRDRDYGLQHIV